MKKINPLSTAMTALFVVVFNIGFFACVSEFTAARWVSWLFIHLAYALLVVASRTASVQMGGLVYGYPRILVAAACFGAEFVLGFIFILANPSGAVFPFLLQLVLLAGFAFVYLTLLKSEESSKPFEEQTRRELHFVRDCALRLQSAMKAAENNTLRGDIEKLYDAVRNAQGKSIPEVADIEAELLGIADSIYEAVTNNTPDVLPASLKRGHALVVKRDNAIRLSQYETGEHA